MPTPCVPDKLIAADRRGSECVDQLRLDPSRDALGGRAEDGED